MKDYGVKRRENKLNYEVIEKLGTLDTDGKFIKELRVVSWNGKDPVFDIRGYYEENGEEKMTKGITMDNEELRSLYEILKDVFESEDDE